MREIGVPDISGGHSGWVGVVGKPARALLIRNMEEQSVRMNQIISSRNAVIIEYEATLCQVRWHPLQSIASQSTVCTIRL